MPSTGRTIGKVDQGAPGAAWPVTLDESTTVTISGTTTITGPVTIADGSDAALGAKADAESASGSGSLIAIAKRLRTLLNGGLPAALGAGGGLKVDGSGTALPVSGPLTDTQLRATRVPVDGSGVTQPVSGPLTDTQLRATRVPVDGSGVTQPISGSVGITGTPTVAGSGIFHVDDNAGTLTVDDGGLTLSIDDGGGSVTSDLQGSDGGQTLAVAVLQRASGNALVVSDQRTHRLLGQLLLEQIKTNKLLEEMVK